MRPEADAGLQVTFCPDLPSKAADNIQLLSLPNLQLPLYTHSFLGFGQDAALTLASTAAVGKRIQVNSNPEEAEQQPGVSWSLVLLMLSEAQWLAVLLLLSSQAALHNAWHQVLEAWATAPFTPRLNIACLLGRISKVCRAMSFGSIPIALAVLQCARRLAFSLVLWV